MKQAKIILAAALLACAALFVFLRSHSHRIADASPGFRLLVPGPGMPFISTGTFSSGDSISVAFHSNAAYSDIIAVESALKKAGSGALRPGDLYAVGISSSGRVGGFALARGEELYLVRRSSIGFTYEKGSLPVTVVRREAAGNLKSSLWEAMSSTSVPAGVIMEFADIFAWKVDFLTEPREGDRFALVWEERTTALGYRCGSRILAAAYRGSEAGSEEAFYSGSGYYDAEGRSLSRAFLRAPLSYRRISSYFSKRRFHPILRIYRAHNGIDYAAPSGTPVSAVADGTITFVGRRGGYGNFIELRHGGGYITGYGHLRGFAKGVKRGKHVNQGQLIGYVGMTGLATGPHLDFSIKSNGRYVNFLKLKLPPSSALAGEALKNFSSEIKALREQLQAAGAVPGKENV